MYKVQRLRLLGVIKTVTIASFKMLSNKQVMDLGFPLPAIPERMALIEKKKKLH